jgi:aerotaxis receptor
MRCWNFKARATDGFGGPDGGFDQRRGWASVPQSGDVRLSASVSMAQCAKSGAKRLHSRGCVAAFLPKLSAPEKPFLAVYPPTPHQGAIVMRVNMPVTNRERLLEPGKPIVTKTDLDGKIVYANESFVAMSGFTREELIGSDHNIVRHPDMPPAAFEDLWRTVRAGQPWRGLVKNRCKNGDYYWVEAYVTPILVDGRTTGYMSVRNTPARADVEAAEELYAGIRTNSRKMPQTPLFAARANLGARMALGVAGLAALALIPAVADLSRWWTLSTLPAGLALLLWLRAAVLLPIERANQAIALLAEGKLQHGISGHSPGALGGLLTRMESLRIHLRATFSDVLIGSRAVEESARVVDAEIRGLVGEAEQQVERVMQIAAAMEQMSVSISEISEHTKESLATSEQSRQTVDASSARMDDSIARTQKIVAVVDQSGRQMDMLAAAVARIGNVTDTIREVADRTNLLALNAAIEAARAGEEGRGFAVVADEVRKLAEQTAASTVEIAKTVENIREVAGVTDQTMKSAAGEVAESSTAIQGAKEALDRIRSSSDRVVVASREISEMLRQQSSASHEVASNMEKISAAIDRANHGLSAVGGTSSRLKGTAGELRELVRHLEASLK